MPRTRDFIEPIISEKPSKLSINLTARLHGAEAEHGALFSLRAASGLSRISVDPRWTALCRSLPGLATGGVLQIEYRKS